MVLVLVNLKILIASQNSLSSQVIKNPLKCFRAQINGQYICHGYNFGLVTGSNPSKFNIRLLNYQNTIKQSVENGNRFV